MVIEVDASASAPDLIVRWEDVAGSGNGLIVITAPPGTSEDEIREWLRLTAEDGKEVTRGE